MLKKQLQTVTVSIESHTVSRQASSLNEDTVLMKECPSDFTGMPLPFISFVLGLKKYQVEAPLSVELA